MILFLILWIILNVFVIENGDPYPFILLNLLLSCIAALQAPIIMMSQNRQAERVLKGNLPVFWRYRSTEIQNKKASHPAGLFLLLHQINACADNAPY